jgi:hypothetical protein
MFRPGSCNYRADMTVLTVGHFAGSCPGTPHRLGVQVCGVPPRLLSAPIEAFSTCGVAPSE